MLLDELVDGAGAGQLAGLCAPGAAYGRPGAQRAQQPRQTTGGKASGPPAATLQGGQLRHEAGAPLQLRGAAGPRRGSALGKISESAEWAEQSARGAADSALDDEFEALFAEAAGLGAPWAEGADSTPSLPSAMGNGAPVGLAPARLPQEAAPAQRVAGAEADPRFASEAAPVEPAAGAEAEPRLASFESRPEALLEASWGSYTASQPEPEPRGSQSPVGAGGEPASQAAGSLGLEPAEARALADQDLDEPGDDSTIWSGAEPPTAKPALQDLEELEVLTTIGMGVESLPAKPVLQDLQGQEASIDLELSGEEAPPAKPAFQGLQGQEGSIDILEMSEEEPPPARPAFHGLQGQEGSIEIEMSEEEPLPARPAFQGLQGQAGSIEIEMSEEEPPTAKPALQDLEELEVSTTIGMGVESLPAKPVLQDLQGQAASSDLELSGEEAPPAKPAFQGLQGQEGSIDILEMSEEEPPPARPAFQGLQGQAGSIEIEMSEEEPPPAKPAFQDMQAEEDSIEIEMCEGEDGAGALPKGAAEPRPGEVVSAGAQEPQAPLRGGPQSPEPSESGVAPTTPPVPPPGAAAALGAERASDARHAAADEPGRGEARAPVPQPTLSAPVPASPPGAAAALATERASETRHAAANEPGRSEAQEQPAEACSTELPAVCGAGAPGSTAPAGGDGGLGLLDMMDRAVKHVEGSALETGPRPVSLGNWPCPSCTYHNDAAAMSCEVCSAARQCEDRPGLAQGVMQSGGSSGSRAHPAAPRPPLPARTASAPSVPALQVTPARRAGPGDDEPGVIQAESNGAAAPRNGSSSQARPSASSNIVSRVDVVDQAVHRRAAPGAARDTDSGVADSGGSLGLGLGSSRALAGLRQAYQVPNADEPEVSTRRPRVTFEGVQEETVEEAATDRVEEHAGMEAEWDVVAERTAEMAAIAEREKANAGRVGRLEDPSASSIAWREVHQWMLEVRILPEVLQPLRDEEMDQVRCGCMARRRSVSDVPGLDRKVNAEKDLVLMMKMTKFDFNETVHARMLRTMYFKLTRNKVCGTIGGHWEVMGFQHTDPRTDLNRSNGVLNVIHMFSFYTRHFDIFKSAFTLAQDAEQNYPLACVCVNITQMVMTAFLSGALSSLCNSGDRGVFDTLCCVFAGGLFHFYSQWRSRKRTIRDTDQTFKEIEQLVNRRPARLLDALTKGAAELKAKSDPSRLEFSNLEFGASRASQPQAARPQGALPSRLRNYQQREGPDG